MIDRLYRLWGQRKAAVVMVVLVTSGAVLGAVRLIGHSPSVPTLTIQPGEFVDSVEFRGEIKALKSIGINAPAEAGELQILKIAADGAQLKKGEQLSSSIRPNRSKSWPSSVPDSSPRRPKSIRPGHRRV